VRGTTPYSRRSQVISTKQLQRNNMIRNNKTSITAGIVFLILSFPSTAEIDAYMFVTGQSGPIIGDVELPGREGSFKISEFHHLYSLDSRNDISHKPLIITTPMSKSTPLLLMAMDNNSPLQVEIKFYRIDLSSGIQENHYSMLLGNAQIETIEPIMFDNTEDNHTAKPVVFRLRFNYQGITHTYEPDNQEVILEVSGPN